MQVMTVAHCVYEPWRKIWWQGLEFHPGRNLAARDVGASSPGDPLALPQKQTCAYTQTGHPHQLLPRLMLPSSSPVNPSAELLAGSGINHPYTLLNCSNSSLGGVP